jgi:glyoxalase family protein
MTLQVPGLHHVTAIAGDAQRTADFYAELLGLRLVKRTVNHDDSRTYHLYFGDGVGTPGTTITVFPWGEDGRQGRFGAGQTAATAYGLRPSSVGYWADRLADHGVAVERSERFGEPVLAFEDPDGIAIELVASEEAAEADVEPWPQGPVPEDHRLRGLHSVTLAVGDRDRTAAVLETLGLEREATDGDRVRYRTAAGGTGSAVDLLVTDRGRGRMGVGTVHHVAFAAADTGDLTEWQTVLGGSGLEATDVIDRTYFDAIYVREPGGVLIEIATLDPGFDVDEPVERLGESLALPAWLEEQRRAIEAALPPLRASVAEP